jgi:hypothetical protein
MAASRRRLIPVPKDRAAAQAVMDVLLDKPLYARVDMVRGEDGGLMLMELEVLEPYLYPKDGPHIGAMLGEGRWRGGWGREPLAGASLSASS